MSGRLENWGDLFKYSKELLEDDFNKDQAVVIKTKSKSLDGSTVRLYSEEILKGNQQHF